MPFQRPAGATAPAYDLESITPNDTTILTDLRGLYVGTTGDIAITTISGSTVTLSSVPVGILPVIAERVKSTGTTASNIVGLK